MYRERSLYDLRPHDGFRKEITFKFAVNIDMKVCIGLAQSPAIYGSELSVQLYCTIVQRVRQAGSSYSWVSARRAQDRDEWRFILEISSFEA